MLEFTSKAKAAEDALPDDIDADAADDAPQYEPFKCMFDGEELVGSIRPKDAIIAQLAPASHRRTEPAMRIHLALNFLGDVLDPPSRAYIEGRLLDPKDKLDASDVMPVLEALGNHWKKIADAEKAERRSRRGR